MDPRDIKNQLDRIEDKLDSHLERIAKTEVEVSGIKGFVKAGLGLMLTIFSGLVSLLFSNHFKG